MTRCDIIIEFMMQPPSIYQKIYFFNWNPFLTKNINLYWKGRKNNNKNYKITRFKDNLL